MAEELGREGGGELDRGVLLTHRQQRLNKGPLHQKIKFLDTSLALIRSENPNVIRGTGGKIKRGGCRGEI